MDLTKRRTQSSVRLSHWVGALALAVAVLAAMSSPALTAETSADPKSDHKNMGAAPAENLRSPYAALRGTAATGLLPEEVEGLVSGKGMALALAAEVNGYPGPRHVLEAAETSQLSLRPDQLSAIQQLNDRMLQEAQAKGQEILQAEAHLAQRFREGHIDEPSLGESLEHIGRLRAELRLVHLRTHLTTRELLTAEQIAQYNIVRGYEVSSGGHHPQNR